MQRVRDPSATATSPQTAFDQFLFRDQSFGVAEKEQEGSKGLRLDCQQLRPP